MKVKSLENTGFSEIISCFLECFENYYVQFPNDAGYFRKRWKSTGVRFDLSFGMFDNKKLVGFIFHAIDHRNGKKTAYNTGTGVLPNYRGRKIIDKIYDFATPLLKANGVERCCLEVITENIAAIKVYERCGFSKTRTYKCFRAVFFHKPKPPENLREVLPELFDWSLLPDQDLYSWDNHKKSVKRSDYRYFILGQHSAEAVFIINPETGYIPQLKCLVDNDETWKALFDAIASVSSEVRINNVDSQLKEKIRRLQNAGFMNLIDQYQMERKL